MLLLKTVIQHYKRDIHPELLRNTNRFETIFQQLPVGTNQYRAAGFQRTNAK